MASTTLISVSEYLATSYRPDCDYVDGEVRERNLGETPHSGLQGFLYYLFRTNAEAWQMRPYPEQRVQVAPTRFRIPDVCVLPFGQPRPDGIVRTPPLICIEVLSPGDSMSSMQERIADYQAFGVPHIWLFDPIRRLAWSMRGEDLHPEREAFTLPGTPVHIPLALLNHELDEIAAGR